MVDVQVSKDMFIVESKDRIEDHYDGIADPKGIIGKGSFGQVAKVTHKVGKQVRACKIIPKSRIKDPKKFKIEIDILKDVDHPNIIKLYETFEDQLNVYLVMEVCEGGELFDRIIDKGHFSEKEARDVFGQLVRSLLYLHKKDICHRDLKPENFLYLSKKEDSPIKMIDFGLSKKFMDPGRDKKDIEN